MAQSFWVPKCPTYPGTPPQTPKYTTSLKTLRGQRNIMQNTLCHPCFLLAGQVAYVEGDANGVLSPKLPEGGVIVVAGAGTALGAQVAESVIALAVAV